MWGVIGGSGFESLPGVEKLEEIKMSTPFGPPSSGLMKGKLADTEFFFLSRHGRHHELLPTEINVRANLWAFYTLGVRRVLAFSAVGSLQQDLAPGEAVVPTQFINRTWGRPNTFGGDGAVIHAALAEPVSVALVDWLREHEFAFPVHFDRTLVIIEGPQFSTRAEALAHRQLGADLVGMTAYPEYALAREAGMAYLPVTFVTDYDCWDPNMEHVTLDMVRQVMRENATKALLVAEHAFTHAKDIAVAGCPEMGVMTSLLTPKDRLSTIAKERLSVFLG